MAEEMLQALIEIPAGSINKYEYDSELGVFRLSRVLFPSVRYPVNYGMLPGTRAGDGDRLDIMVLSEEPMLRGTLLSVRPVALLRMSDQKGEDMKVLAVPENDPHYDSVRGSDDVPPNRLRQIELFFQLYRLPDAHPENVKIDGWASADDAWKLIRGSIVMAPEEDEIFRTGSRAPAG